MPVEYEKKGHVAIITMNRPEARNAINGEMAQTMEAALDVLLVLPWRSIRPREGKHRLIRDVSRPSLLT